MKVGRAVAKATLFSITNPDAAFNLMKQAIPEEYENDETGRLYLQTYIDLTTPTDISKGFGSIDRESWEITQNLFLEGEDPILSEPVDLDALLDESLLEEMNSFDVEEIEEMAKNWE